MTTELDWDTLIQQIKDGEFTPFIGAGTAFGVLPFPADLAETTLQEEETRSKVKSPIRERTDFARVAQYRGKPKGQCFGQRDA